jgi:hypothetical protein
LIEIEQVGVWIIDPILAGIGSKMSVVSPIKRFFATVEKRCPEVCYESPMNVANVKGDILAFLNPRYDKSH